MTPTVWTKIRCVIPRWRSFTHTSSVGELSSPGTVKRVSLESEIPDKISNWKHSPSITSAGELVQISIIEAKIESEAISAAEYLVSKSNVARSALVELAQKMLNRVNTQDSEVDRNELQPCEVKAELLNGLRVYKRNPFAWVDLARVNLILGKKKLAERNIQEALKIAPNNRFVIRSASRLYLSLDDPLMAYRVVKNCNATPFDPWLLAAEFSLAKLNKKGPHFMREGRALVKDSNFSPRQLSELNSALAMLELSRGKPRIAKKLFQQSLRDPTGNAVAQAKWVILMENKNFLLDFPDFNEVYDTEEAEVYHYLNESKYKEAIEACKCWSETEKFSIRPIETGVSIASLIKDYKGALSIIDGVSECQKQSPTLLNLKAYTLAQLGQLDVAEESLKKIDETNQVELAISLANWGMIKFRRKDYCQGVENYERALSLFKQKRKTKQLNVAKIFYACEAANSKYSGARELVDGVLKFKKNEDYKFYIPIVKDAERALS